MDAAKNNIEKFREDILKSLGVSALPEEAAWLLDYRVQEKIKPEIWRDLLFLFTNSKMRDTSNLSLEQKFILLDSLRLCLLQENKPLDRQLFAKKIRERLKTTREIFLDMQDIINYQAAGKDKFRLSSLRKYGPVKDSTFRNPLREKFAQAISKRDFLTALETLLLINYRKIANLQGLTKEYLEQAEKELLNAAAQFNLNVNKLKTDFAADRPKLKYAEAPITENKVNIVFKSPDQG